MDGRFTGISSGKQCCEGGIMGWNKGLLDSAPVSSQRFQASIQRGFLKRDVKIRDANHGINMIDWAGLGRKGP